MSRTWIAAAVAAAVALGACGSDDSGGTGPQQDELVGTWISAGAQVAPGLAGAPFNTDSIVAIFNANQTYEVRQWAGGSNQAVVLSGNWQAGTQAAGSVRSITVNQNNPGALTSQGIFRVQGTSMQYEVIQTEPALQGVNPPTVAGGFGSTTVGGQATGAFWTQTYTRRQ